MKDIRKSDYDKKTDHLFQSIGRGDSQNVAFKNKNCRDHKRHKKQSNNLRQNDGPVLAGETEHFFGGVLTSKIAVFIIHHQKIRKYETIIQATAPKI